MATAPSAISRVETLCKDIKALVSQIQVEQADQSAMLDAERAQLNRIEQAVNPPPPPGPMVVRAFSDFGPPIHRKGVLVLNYDLKNDWIVGPVAIKFVDAEGNVEPGPDGAMFTSVVDDPSLLNVVDNDGTHFTMNALKRRGTATITHTEAAGLVPPYTDTINIVEDLTPTGADSNFPDAPHTPQPLPPP